MAEKLIIIRANHPIHHHPRYRYIKPKVPAHRIVNRLGILSGKHHFYPHGMMEKPLKKEGIKVKNDQVVDFKKIFWDPVEELGF